MQAIIFPEKYSAMKWDWEHNTLKGSISTYRYNRVLLNQTTTLTKAEYAELLDIPATITDMDGNETDNPRYTELEDSYTLDKVGLVVGDDFAVKDDEGRITGHKDKDGNALEVVDISNQLKEVSEV